MTGTKGHSGGKRPGQGRKPKPGKKYLLPIRCETEEQYRIILATTTPETRVALLIFPPPPPDHEN